MKVLLEKFVTDVGEVSLGFGEVRSIIPLMICSRNFLEWVH